MAEREMICIVCPIGCHLKIDIMGDSIKVHGNKCPKGDKYAHDEMTNPIRSLSTTVKIENAKLRRLPVKSEKEIPKSLIFTAMDEINKVSVKAPIEIGAVVLENVAGSGVDIVASRSM